MDTSREAFQRILETLPRRRGEVLQTFIDADGDLTAQEVADRLGWGIQSVTGRMLELRKEKLLVYVRTRKQKSGFNAKAYRLAKINHEDYLLKTLLGDLPAFTEYRDALTVRQGRIETVRRIPHDIWTLFNHRLTRRGYVYEGRGVWS